MKPARGFIFLSQFSSMANFCEGRQGRIVCQISGWSETLLLKDLPRYGHICYAFPTEWSVLKHAAYFEVWVEFLTLI